MTDNQEREDLEEERILDKRIDISKKESELKENHVNSRYEQYQEGKIRIEKADNFSFKNRRENIARSIEKGKESSKYIEDSYRALTFISDTFNTVIPFFCNNLILASSKTGHGKTTIVSNVVYSILCQKNTAVLVLTNEEKEVDVYNRVTALMNGWHYVNHNMISKEQMSVYEKTIPILSQKLTVIDNHDEEIPESTTTLEGIKSLLEKALLDKNKDGTPFYSAIIIDYYQGVTESDKFIQLNEYEVQRRLVDYLGDYITRAPFPLLLLSQLSDRGKGKNELEYKRRIEGTKKILNKATCAIEVTADRENLRTAWTVHKGRYVKHVGQTFFTGYDKGRFVEYTSDFEAMAEVLKIDRENKKKSIKESSELMEQIESSDE